MISAGRGYFVDAKILYPEEYAQLFGPNNLRDQFYALLDVPGNAQIIFENKDSFKGKLSRDLAKSNLIRLYTVRGHDEVM